MKKLTLLLFVAILLIACQPAAPAPVEALAGSVNDLLGVWWFPQGGLKMEFKADGTCRVFSGSANIGQVAEGTYTFDAGKVTFSGSADCDVNPTSYEAYVTTQDGNPVSLRMQVVGSDPCSDRANVLKGIGKFQNP